MRHRQVFLTLPSVLTCALLSACGSSSPSDKKVDPVPVVSNSISGMAAKGVVKGGTVSVYSIVEGKISDAPLETAVTDMSGGYTLNVMDYSGPVLVRVTANDTAMMVCDLAGGCGSSVFGEMIPLIDTDFSLDAVLTVDGNPATGNVSVLTDIAAEAVLDEISKTGIAKNEDVIALIQELNGSIANRFGLAGQLTSMPIVDLTNPTAVADADQAALQYNLMGAGAISAVLTEGSVTTISDALNHVTNQYLTSGGVPDTESAPTTVLTLEEILAASSAVIGSMQEQDTSNSLDLEPLKNLIDAKQMLASRGSEEPTTGAPDAGNVDGLGKVKAMVADIRNLSTTVVSPFEEQYEVLYQTFEGNSGATLTALSKTAQAIRNAFDVFRDDLNVRSYEDEETDLTVTIAIDDNEEVTFAVKDDLPLRIRDQAETVMIDLKAVGANSQWFTDAPEAKENTEVAQADIHFDLSGSLVSSDSTLAVNSGVITIVNFQAEYIDDSVDNDSIESLNIAINITLSENTSSPTQFTGDLNFAVSGVKAFEERKRTFMTSDGQAFSSFLETETLGVETVDLTLSGVFTAPDMTKLTASLSLNAKSNGFEQVCTTTDYENETCSVETDDKYVGLSYGAALLLDKGDAASNISLNVSGSRTGLEDTALTFEIKTGTTVLDLKFDTALQTDTSLTATITNQEGVVATLIQTNTDDDESLSGSIKFDEVEYATVSDELGFIAVSYNDGTNESL